MCVLAFVPYGKPYMSVAMYEMLSIQSRNVIFVLYYVRDILAKHFGMVAISVQLMLEGPPSGVCDISMQSISLYVRI